MNSYLILTDFDQTVGDTFTSRRALEGTKIHGTPDVYEATTEAMFGAGAYAEIGSMQNRSPIQVATALAQLPDRWSAACQAAEIDPRHPDAIILMTREMNKRKLGILVDQIGTELRDSEDVWPPPLPGFVAFTKQLQFINETTKDVKVHWGVVSSGHDEFIDTTFKQWTDFYNVEILPDITITQDTIDTRSQNGGLTRPDRRSKPSPLPLALGIKEWHKMNNLLGPDGRPARGVQPADFKSNVDRIMYMGDDPNRDGGMAHNADIVFGLMEPGTAFTSFAGEKRFTFGTWIDIGRALINQTHALSEGRAFDEVFFGQHITHPESMYARRHGERK